MPQPCPRLAAHAFLWVLLSLSPVGALAREGGMASSGGGSFVIDENNPWFVGEAPVKYCVEASASDFSLSLAEARAQIREALDQWTAAFAQIPTTTYAIASPGGPTRALSRGFIEDCAGAVDLRFYLGSRNREIGDKVDRYTTGLTYPTHYDPVLGRKRGFIWIAADQGSRMYRGMTVAYHPEQIKKGFWKLDHRFFNVVLHEIGHLYFGHQHLLDTLMEEKAPADFAMGLPVRADKQIQDQVQAYFWRDWADPASAPTCGKLAAGLENGGFSAFGPGLASAKRFCVVARLDAQGARAFEIQLFDDAQASLGSFTLSDVLDQLQPPDAKRDDVDYHRFAEVTANYPVVQPDGTSEIQYFVFARFQMNYDYRGIVRAGGKTYPMTLRTMWPAITGNVLVVDFFDGEKFVGGRLVRDPQLRF
jgi:hypothetical protein